MSIIINLLLGFPLLAWGRKLFWFFVGAIGFIGGFLLADQFLNTNEQWVLLLVSAALGIVGIMLALAVKKFALTMAGFFAGVFLAYRLVDTLGASFGQWTWLAYVIGGVVGSILILSVFDWALILLSSLVGASLISQVFIQLTNSQLIPRTIVFVVLLIIGILIQSSQKQKDT